MTYDCHGFCRIHAFIVLRAEDLFKSMKITNGKTFCLPAMMFLCIFWLCFMILLQCRMQLRYHLWFYIVYLLTLCIIQVTFLVFWLFFLVWYNRSFTIVDQNNISKWRREKKHSKKTIYGLQSCLDVNDTILVWKNFRSTVSLHKSCFAKRRHNIVAY